MRNLSRRVQFILAQPLYFLVRVIVGFRANQGLLLAGAVAYYALLSLVPMFALILVGLSQVIASDQLLEATHDYLALIAPGQAEVLTQQIAEFVENWKVIGVVGFFVLLFFSSMAFTVLENAISVIFSHRVAIHRRHFLVSAILPFCYLCLLGLGLFVVTLVSSALHTLDDRTVPVLGSIFGSYYAIGIYIVGLLGEILLLTSLYLVMPVGRIAFRHALIGGMVATLLWELTRQGLVWYFSTLSFVNIIYGSFAAVVMILLSLEAAAIIVLFGAQVIAEYERLDTQGKSPSRFQT
ncbi:YihY/virulence factor BrkB family protein [Nitrosococcus watsonii]|uniref:Ribonuclease BN n=1 Tax=Nitrosococcus watsoni (strain C-113) TaxID=105559 RepID=D8KBC1_NITWC|nr:YihY/virulence factor BrkB family protein [Nitrosococcus watsonii]ADJ29568.1 ribonuclease BN [Nitrosococcus watsonii C-113]